MLKLKKVFLLGLLTVAVSMFTASCILEDEPEDEGYTISISGGTMEWWEDPTDEDATVPLKNGDILYKNDIVIILSANPAAGKVFSHWVAEPNLGSFHDETNPYTTYTMPAADIKIRAVFVDALVKLRFAWPADEQNLIEYIFADSANIAWWYDEIWDDGSIVDEDFVVRPGFVPGQLGGIPGFPEIFKKNGSASNKGKYINATPGSYIAVCSVQDPYFDETIWEIVADYTIAVTGANAVAQYEIGFPLTEFFEEEDHLGWYGFAPNGSEDPRVTKRKDRRSMFKTVKVEGADGTLDVTYYAFPRTKK